MKLGVTTEVVAPRPRPAIHTAPSSLTPRRSLPVIPCDPTPAKLGDVVEPGKVRAPLDRFRCEPYVAVLTGRACVERQKAAGTQSSQRGMGDGWRQTAKHGDYALCRGCEVGAGIRKRIAS